MSVYYNSARSRWLYDFEFAGKRFAGYCKDPSSGEPAKNKTQAKRIEALMRAAAIAAAEAETTKPNRASAYTVAQMFAEFASRKCTGRNWSNEQGYVRELIAFFGADTPVDQITEARVWDYITWSRNQPVKVYMGAGVTRALLQRCGRLRICPVRKPIRV